MNNPLIGGLNRGARAIVKELPEETIRRYEPEWLLADPKENRARQMAGVLTNRFATLRPQPLQMPVQDALALSRDHDTVVLALDTIADTLDTLSRRIAQRIIWQITGRGPGGGVGPRIALQGTLCPGDQQTERAVSLLLPTLAGMSQAASSRHLTGPDPLSAAVLSPLRQVASRQTVRHLAEKEREPRDLSGGPLSVSFGQTLYPLVPVQGLPQDTHVQWKARALDMAGGVPAKHLASRGLPGGDAMVAVVIPDQRAIHFIKVAQSRTGKRSIAGVTSFVSPRVQQQSQSAVFTD